MQGQKIEAVKRVKELTGLGLKEAIEYVDKLVSEQDDATPLISTIDEVEVRDQLIQGKRIEAMKRVRQLTGCGLDEAKEYISALDVGEIEEIILVKKLRPLGNRKRLAQTDNQYNVRLFLFADKHDSETYYSEFVNYAKMNHPPFFIEIMLVNIHTIYDEPFGLVFPNEITDTRPEYADWFREATLTCNEVLNNFQAADHSYEMLNQYVKELFDWTILTPAPIDRDSPEATDIFSDPPDSGFTPLKLK